MKNRMYFIIIFFFAAAGISANDADIYLNAGTEKYLQGDYAKAIENLEKAREADPGNAQVNNFLAKIIIEAGTNSNLTHDYSEALVYLEKGKKYFPENSKINELYSITRGVLEKTDEKKTVIQPAPVPKNDTVKKETGLVETPKPRPAQAQPTVIIKEVVRPPEKIYPYELIYLLVVLAAALAAGALLLIYLLYSKINQNKKIEALNSALKILESEKNETKKTTELENIKKEIKNELDEKIRNEYEEKYKIYSNTKDGENLEKIVSDRVQQKIKETQLKNQVESMNSLIGEIGALSGVVYSSDAKNAQTRLRITEKIMELYRGSPESAVDYLKNMSRNPGPGIRSSIIGALSSIAIPETLNILFELYHDSDEFVKREALKWLKILRDNNEKGLTLIDNELKDKISNIIHEEYAKGEWIF